jgi:hypothetical protein
MSFLHGLGLGLSTAIILGPVFFTLLRNSIAYGRRFGIATATGIIVSDVVVLVLCYTLSKTILESWMQNDTVKFIAVGLLLLFGISFIWKKIELDLPEIQPSASWGKAFLQGFLINGVNPWAGQLFGLRPILLPHGHPFRDFSDRLLKSRLLPSFKTLDEYPSATTTLQVAWCRLDPICPAHGLHNLLELVLNHVTIPLYTRT